MNKEKVYNVVKKTVAASLWLGILAYNGCTSNTETPTPASLDSPEKPYVQTPLKDLRNQDVGTRVIVKAEIRNLERTLGNDILIVESDSYISNVLRNEYTTSSVVDGILHQTDSASWSNLAPLLREQIANKADTSNIFDNVVNIYGVVNSDKLLEMRFIGIDNNLYDAFK